MTDLGDGCWPHRRPRLPQRALMDPGACRWGTLLPWQRGQRGPICSWPPRPPRLLPHPLLAQPQVKGRNAGSGGNRLEVGRGLNPAWAWS